MYLEMEVFPLSSNAACTHLIVNMIMSLWPDLAPPSQSFKTLAQYFVAKSNHSPHFFLSQQS